MTVVSRTCARCSRPLSRYNNGDYCGSCEVSDDRAKNDRISPEAASEIGERLKAVRQRRGMTLRVVAGLAGVSAPYLSMVETGKRSLDRYSLIRDLAEALRVPASDLAPELSEARAKQSLPVPLAGPDWNWCSDPLIDLAELEGTDLHTRRRELLTGAACSAMAIALPDAAWWRSQEAVQAAVPKVQGKTHRIGADDVAAVQQLGLAFSRLDQLRGGGHSRKAIAQYLHSNAATMLQGCFASERVRSDMFSALGELAYLSGWMAFDNYEHIVARRYFVLALKLAARAANASLAGHILRAMAHQALDLGMASLGLDLAEASVEGQRYRSATPRERALLGVVHARALAATGSKAAAGRALLRAEDDLRCASPGIAEPSRTFFFGEASLAHETGRTLLSCGDTRSAIRQFQDSVGTRGAAFRRTQAVTLGYLGAAQMTSGDIEEACATWSQALDLIEDGGIKSGRTRQTAADIRQMTTPFRHSRRIPVLASMEERVSAYLAEID